MVAWSQTDKAKTDDVRRESPEAINAERTQSPAVAKPSDELAPSGADQPLGKELALFQREWKFESCMSETWHVENEAAKQWRWTVKGDQITWNRPGAEVWILSFTIDETTFPKQIDFTFLNGPHKWKNMRLESIQPRG